MKSGAALALCAIALLLAPTALAATPAPTITPVAGTTVYKIGIEQSYDGMNPFSSWSAISGECFKLCYDYLTWYDKSYRPAPDLATSWQTSADGKTWTFHIRAGMTWQDGVRLTAHDIAFTYNLILGTRNPSYSRYLAGVTSVVAPDDTTLVIRTKAPDAGMLALAIPILPQHVWKHADPKDLGGFSNWPFVGSGPFRVTELQQGRWVKLEANSSYPRALGGPPKVDAVYFVVAQSTASMIDDYKAGRLDAVAGFPSTYEKLLGSLPGSTAVAAPTIGFHELGFNCGNAPGSLGNPLLKDPAIRRAVHWAIDTGKINDAAMAGLAVPGASVVSPVQSLWRWDVPPALQYTYNPAKAREILAAAGYIDRNGDGVRESAKGRQLSFRLAVLNQYPEDQAAAGLIVKWCAAVGIKLQLEQMDEGAFDDLIYDHANYDLFLWSWGGDVDPGAMLSTFTTGQILNLGNSQYSNPAYDKLYVKQAEALNAAQPSDFSRRKAIIDRMQRLLYRDDPYVVLWYNVNLQAFRTATWTGYERVPAGSGAPFWNGLRTTYVDLTPITAAVTGKKKSKSTTPSWLPIALAAGSLVLAGGVGAVYVRWRRKPTVKE